MEKTTVQKDYVTKTEFRSSINAINSTLKAHSTELKGLKTDMHDLKGTVNGLKATVRGLEIAVNSLKIAVAEINRSLSKLTGIVLRIEERNNVYSDMYEINKWNVNKLANRVNKLEKQGGLTPPQELLISGL